MPSHLTLHPTAAAAAQALSEGEGGALVAGDLARGFFAFALEMARKVRPFHLPDPAQRLTLAWEASQRARMGLPVSACRIFARALSELHGSGLTPDQLRGLDKPDLAAALEAHQQLMTKRELCDPAAVPWLAAEAAAASFVADSIEVAPRIAWTQGELAWMEALGKKCQVTVRLPEDADRPELFAPLDAVHQELARDAMVRLAGPAEGWGGVFAAARRGPSAVPSPAIEAHSLGSAADEARSVAVRVRSLLRSGISPDAIAVTALGELGPEIFTALDAAGIPVGQGRRMLTATPAGQVPLMVLATAEEGVPRERLCELLEARLLAVCDPILWARRLREAGCGSHARQRLFPLLEALLQRKSKYARDGLPALEGTVDLIAALPAQGTIADLARALWKVLDELGILKKLTTPLPEKKPSPEKSPPAKVRQLSLFEVADPEARSFASPWVEVARSERLMALDQVRETFDSLVRLDVAGRSVTIGELATLVRDALAATPFRAVPALAGGVVVAPVEALEGRRFSHVFITGLAGDGPPTSEDAFLPESWRRSACALLERPALLPPAGPKAGRDAERMALALAAGLASEWLWASGARTRKGKQLEPSPLLAEVGKVAAAGIQVHALRPWPAGGEEALSRDEVCAALPDEPAVREAEPERAPFHRALRQQRLGRDRAILEGRIDDYGGDLTAPDVLPGLALRLAFDDARPLSASRLERLAGCGFHALAKVVLGLDEPDEQDEAIDNRRRGTIVHACLEAAFTELKAAGLLPLRGGERAAGEREVFMAGARKELADREAEGEIGHPAVWAGMRRAIERQLQRLLEAEQRSRSGFVPDAFEVKFGGVEPDRPSQRLTVEGGEITLGGQADRIDRGPAGALRVVDYKGGRIETRNRRLKVEFAERDLQLAHYALILKLAQPEVSVDAAYFSVFDAEYSKSLAEVCNTAKVDLEAFLDATPEGRQRASENGQPNIANRIEARLRRARAGEFPVEPGDCAWCKFAAGCRAAGLREDWE